MHANILYLYILPQSLLHSR